MLNSMYPTSGPYPARPSLLGIQFSASHPAPDALLPRVLCSPLTPKPRVPGPPPMKRRLSVSSKRAAEPRRKIPCVIPFRDSLSPPRDEPPNRTSYSVIVKSSACAQGESAPSLGPLPASVSAQGLGEGMVIVAGTNPWLLKAGQSVFKYSLVLRAYSESAVTPPSQLALRMEASNEAQKQGLVSRFSDSRESHRTEIEAFSNGLAGTDLFRVCVYDPNPIREAAPLLHRLCLCLMYDDSSVQCVVLADKLQAGAGPSHPESTKKAALFYHGKKAPMFIA